MATIPKTITISTIEVDGCPAAYCAGWFATLPVTPGYIPDGHADNYYPMPPGYMKLAQSEYMQGGEDQLRLARGLRKILWLVFGQPVLPTERRGGIYG